MSNPRAFQEASQNVMVCGPHLEIMAEVSVKIGGIRDPSGFLKPKGAEVTGPARSVLKNELENAFIRLMQELFGNDA